MQGLLAPLPRESFANLGPDLPSWLYWYGTAVPSTGVQRRLVSERMNGAVTLGASEWVQ